MSKKGEARDSSLIDSQDKRGNNTNDNNNNAATSAFTKTDRTWAIYQDEGERKQARKNPIARQINPLDNYGNKYAPALKYTPVISLCRGFQ